MEFVRVIIKLGRNRNVPVEGRRREEVSAPYERVDQGRHNRIAPTVLLGNHGNL